MNWDVSPTAFVLPLFNYPIAWYGLFFAIGFWIAQCVFIYLGTLSEMSKEEAKAQASRLCFPLLISTLFGAKLLHFVCYENPSVYWANPWLLLQFWGPGLASHGGILGAVVALWIFAKKEKLCFMKLLDRATIASFFLAPWIRLGNFFNQEVLGTVTDLPWAVRFLQADPLALPRHPVQLYEALGYAFLALEFLIVYHFVSKKRNGESLIRRGGLITGLGLIYASSFRFLVEFCKEEQSPLLSFSSFTMGQWLTIPLFLWGIYLWMRIPVGPKKNSLERVD